MDMKMETFDCLNRYQKEKEERERPKTKALVCQSAGDALADAMAEHAKRRTQTAKLACPPDGRDLGGSHGLQHIEFICEADTGFERFLNPKEKLEWKEYESNLKHAAFQERTGGKAQPLLDDSPDETPDSRLRKGILRRGAYRSKLSAKCLKVLSSTGSGAVAVTAVNQSTIPASDWRRSHSGVIRASEEQGVTRHSASQLPSWDWRRSLTGNVASGNLAAGAVPVLPEIGGAAGGSEDVRRHEQGRSSLGVGPTHFHSLLHQKSLGLGVRFTRPESLTGAAQLDACSDGASPLSREGGPRHGQRSLTAVQLELGSNGSLDKYKSPKVPTLQDLKGSATPAYVGRTSFNRPGLPAAGPAVPVNLTGLAAMGAELDAAKATFHRLLRGRVDNEGLQATSSEAGITARSWPKMVGPGLHRRSCSVVMPRHAPDSNQPMLGDPTAHAARAGRREF